MEIKPVKAFDRRLKCKPDKSVTHRAVMFNAAFGERAEIRNPLISADCLSTIDCMRRLGAQIEVGESVRIVKGGITAKSATLDAGNSGTTMRLLSGLLAPFEGRFTLVGDESLSLRPMNRVIAPLSLMGAKISGRKGCAPLEIEGADLHGIDYEMPVNSAQVKSAVLLAGLKASGKTTVREKVVSRDHTERMLEAMGAKIAVDGKSVTVSGGASLHAVDVDVVGDISSAAYPFVFAAGLDGGKVTVENVGINPTRTGILEVLRAMGAEVKIENVRGSAEQTADITVCGRGMRAVTVGGELIPRLIDELPVIAVLMALCGGESVIKDAAELKVKETDRIETTVNALRALGVEAEGTADGMRIYGRGYIPGGGVVDSCGDHRIAMSMSIAMALSERGGTLLGGEACAVSWPDFFTGLFGDKNV